MKKSKRYRRAARINKKIAHRSRLWNLAAWQLPRFRADLEKHGLELATNPGNPFRLPRKPPWRPCGSLYARVKHALAEDESDVAFRWSKDDHEELLDDLLFFCELDFYLNKKNDPEDESRNLVLGRKEIVSALWGKAEYGRIMQRAARVEFFAPAYRDSPPVLTVELAADDWEHAYNDRLMDMADAVRDVFLKNADGELDIQVSVAAGGGRAA